MRKNSRAYKIYTAGMAESEHCLDPVNLSMMKAVAAMIAEATKKPDKKKKCGHVCDESCQVSTKLLFSEADVLRVINYELKVVKHGRLNGVLRGIKLLDTDLELFEAWFTDSMYPWMQSVEDFNFTYSMLCRKFPEWLEKARQHKPKAKTTSNWVV